MYDKYISLPVSQSVPVYWTGQSQVYAPSALEQTPPFKHGFGSHKSTAENKIG